MVEPVQRPVILTDTQQQVRTICLSSMRCTCRATGITAPRVSQYQRPLLQVSHVSPNVSLTP